MHVDGKLEGSIDSKAEVIIGQSGVVDGEIKARRILVSGSFFGKIEAERLEIVASGKVTGEVSVAQLIVESGAHFNGTSRILGDEPPRRITHDKAQAETAEVLEQVNNAAEESAAKRLGKS